MLTQSQPLARLALRISILLALLGAGLWLIEMRGVHLWGNVLICVTALFLLNQLFILIGSAQQTSRQIKLHTESRTNSGKFGKSRLAQPCDPIIQKMASGKGLLVGALKGKLLYFDPFESGHAHLLTFAPSRTGKTICNIISNLLFWHHGSIFVTDVKGELTEITAHAQHAFGQRIIILDPFNNSSFRGMRFNPLSVLVEDIIHNCGKELSALSRLITLQLLPEKNDASDGEFFRNGARRELIALMLYLAAFSPNECHLPKLRALVWSTSEIKRDIAQKMQATDWFKGVVREYGNALAEMLNPDYIKTYGGFRDNAMTAVEIYDGSTVFGTSIMKSDFSLKDLLAHKTTIYCILPENKIQSHGKWQGLITSLLFETIGESRRNIPFLFMLEEMGNLGKLSNLSKALSLLPGKGCRCWMVFQSRMQPEIIYGAAMRQLIEEQSSFIQQWSIRSSSDKKLWSERIGNTTKKSRSLSHDSRDHLTPWRVSVNERAAPVKSVDELAQMNRDWQLIDIDGELVVCAEKVPYFQIEPLRSRAKPSPFHPAGYPKDRPVRYVLKDKL